MLLNKESELHSDTVYNNLLQHKQQEVRNTQHLSLFVLCRRLTDDDLLRPKTPPRFQQPKR
jgi:hypothetical protein